MNILKDRITVSNDTAELSRIRKYLMDFVSKSGLPDGERNKIILAIDEAVTNIIQHAYKTFRDGEIEIDMEITVDKFIAVIKDSGLSFNPDEIKDPDLQKHIKEGRKNGLGIFLIRQIMDEVEYIFREGEMNLLRLVKYIK